MSLFVLIWACATVSLIGLAIRNEANKLLTLSDVFWITVLCPIVVCMWLDRLCRGHAHRVVWRRK